MIGRIANIDHGNSLLAREFGQRKVRARLPCATQCPVQGNPAEFLLKLRRNVRYFPIVPLKPDRRKISRSLQSASFAAIHFPVPVRFDVCPNWSGENMLFDSHNCDLLAPQNRGRNETNTGLLA